VFFFFVGVSPSAVVLPGCPASPVLTALFLCFEGITSPPTFGRRSLVFLLAFEALTLLKFDLGTSCMSPDSCNLYLGFFFREICQGDFTARFSFLLRRRP